MQQKITSRGLKMMYFLALCKGVNEFHSKEAEQPHIKTSSWLAFLLDSLQCVEMETGWSGS